MSPQNIQFTVGLILVSPAIIGLIYWAIRDFGAFALWVAIMIGCGILTIGTILILTSFGLPLK